MLAPVRGAVVELFELDALPADFAARIRDEGERLLRARRRRRRSSSLGWSVSSRRSARSWRADGMLAHHEPWAAALDDLEAFVEQSMQALESED